MKKNKFCFTITTFVSSIITISLIALLFIPFSVFSQQGVAINTTGAAADNSAILDVATSGRGILIPRMTTANRPVNPVEALLIYNTTTQCFEAYNATTSLWISIACLGCTGAPSAPVAAPNVTTATQIIWNWDAVSGANGYKWNNTNDYNSATDNGGSTSYTQKGLACNTTYTLYVWAYNACGNSTATMLTQTTNVCTVACAGGANTITDSRDNKVYKIVQIGTQCWMAQNLDFGTYAIAIVQILPQSLSTKYCYNNNQTNCSTYGGLYEWDVMMNGSVGCNGTGTSQPGCSIPVKGICPTGWHVPSHYEWTLLEKNVGSNPGAFPYDEIVPSFSYLGTDEGNNLRTTTGWTIGTCATPPGGPCIGTNSSGFSALAAGDVLWGSFFMIGTDAMWWTSTGDKNNNKNAWGRHLQYDYANVQRYISGKQLGFSVRCLKD